METNEKHHVSSVELMDFAEYKEKHDESKDTISKIDKVSDVNVELVVRLGKAHSTIQNIRNLKEGDILEVEKNLGHKVDIYLSETKVGIGEAVMMEEHFGIVISEINANKKKEEIFKDNE
ncbi:FliM/FliN family flagellar motor switch protein [Microbacteriaceae bacterium 4G12]